jgi:hypothetical protein
MMKIEGFHKQLHEELFFQLILILKDIIFWLVLVRKPSIWSEGPFYAPPPGGWPPEAKILT